MSLKEILQFAVNGGTSVLLLIIWYITYTTTSRQHRVDLQKMSDITSEAFAKHMGLNSTLIQLLKDDQEYKLHVAGILDRLTIKLETPTQCPILLSGKRIRLEVME